MKQDLSFITKGLELRGQASVRSYSSSEDKYIYDPYYYQAYNTCKGCRKTPSLCMWFHLIICCYLIMIFIMTIRTGWNKQSS